MNISWLAVVDVSTRTNSTAMDFISTIGIFLVLELQLIENTFYSAMLNIAESVPLPEPVSSNSGNSIIIQYNRSTRHWPSSIKFPEFRAIPSTSVSTQFPEFRCGITSRPHPHAYCCDRRLVCGISK
jgi:hypothetical protein